MCFHWCSACGMLQTGMGKEKQQKAFFSFFNSILPIRRFSVGVYSFISSVRLRPVCQRCLHCCCWRCCSLVGLDPSNSLILLLLPLSVAHSSPFSLSPSHRFCGKTVAARCIPPLFPSLTLTLFCVFPIFFAIRFFPSHFQSFIPSFNYFPPPPPFTWLPISLFMMQHGSDDGAACRVSACGCACKCM